MSNLILGDLRTKIGANMGETAKSPLTGTFTTTPGIQANDTLRYDPDHWWKDCWIQDTTVAGGSITQIKDWTQQSSQFAFWTAFSNAGVANADNYELHRYLSFMGLREAINNGIALCGQSVRTLVRDESQVMTANIYQYTPTYGQGGFYTQGVTRCEFLYWTGQPTREFLDIQGWYYLDDQVIQFPEWVVDANTGQTIRFTGYGPLFSRITTDDPTFVVGNIVDPSDIEMISWACTQQAWLMVAGNQTAGERDETYKKAAAAYQNFQLLLHNWEREPIVSRTVINRISPGGWTG